MPDDIAKKVNTKRGGPGRTEERKERTGQFWETLTLREKVPKDSEGESGGIGESQEAG